MHSLLDRSTILAGLVDEMRPLLTPLGGALGDLCAGLGQAEAAEKALETAFMIRAAAEMLELEALREAGSLVETVVPLLNGAPDDLRRAGLPIVQALLGALEQSTDALVNGGDRPVEALAFAREGVERLRLGRSQHEATQQPRLLDLEEMLATLIEPFEDERPASPIETADTLVVVEPAESPTINGLSDFEPRPFSPPAGDHAAGTAPVTPRLPDGTDAPTHADADTVELATDRHAGRPAAPSDAVELATDPRAGQPAAPAAAVHADLPAWLIEPELDRQAAEVHPDRAAQVEAVATSPTGTPLAPSPDSAQNGHDAPGDEPPGLFSRFLQGLGSQAGHAPTLLSGSESPGIRGSTELNDGEMGPQARDLAAPEALPKAAPEAAPARPAESTFEYRSENLTEGPSGTGSDSRTPIEQPLQQWGEGPVQKQEELADDQLTAAESAGKVDPEILEVFLLEANEVLADLQQHQSVIQVEPADHRAASELRRACHTLKGAANVVGFPSIGQVCKAMEDLLDAFLEAEQQPDSPSLEFLRDSHHVLQTLVRDPAEPAATARVPELVRRAAELATGIGLDPELGPAAERSEEVAAWADAVDSFLSDAPIDDSDSPNLGARQIGDESDAEFRSTSGALTSSNRASPETDDAQRGELISVFVMEAEEHLTALSGAALKLDVDGHNAEALNEARRALHTLKGSAGALGLDAIGTLCHETEGRLEECAVGETARLLFEASETVEQLVGNLAKTGREGVLRALDPLALPEAVFLGPAASAQPNQSETVEGPADEYSELDEAPQRSGAVRVELRRIDELLNVVGEVVLTRSGLQQRLERVGRAAEELRLTVARLRRVAQYLEDRYEVAELIRTAPEEPRHRDFDELEMDRYTELHRVSREMAELAADAETTSDDLDVAMKELDAVAVNQGRLGTALQDRLMSVRLVPLSNLATRLHRTARSVALKEGKEIEFVVQGGETELDKRVLEELGDVLLHLIRNAVDHGLELPEERQRLGKPAAGKLSLRAFREGSEAIVELHDDGAGIDLRRVQQRAEMMGLIPAGQELDHQTQLDLIFQPGVSTSAATNEVSGRGVGLDVVRTATSRLKGSIEVTSEAGRGTTFALRLPVVLAVLQAMLVKAGQQTYAIQMAALERVVRTTAQPIMSLGRTPLIELDGETFPYLELGPVIGHAASRHAGEETPLLVVRTGERRVALAVEELLGQQEVVVKSLGPHLRSVRGVLGATIQASGQVVLVLNTTELLNTRVLTLGGVPARPDSATPTTTGALSALVVDDSLSVRKVLARSLERDGWEVRQARDGVNALEVLETFRPHVVLLDIEMPRMDGFELAGILRDVPDYGSPPVIMITSRSGDKHRLRAEELGVAGYVVKPYQESELLALLRQVARASVAA